MQVSYLESWVELGLKPSLPGFESGLLQCIGYLLNAAVSLSVQ